MLAASWTIAWLAGAPAWSLAAFALFGVALAMWLFTRPGVSPRKEQA